MKFEVSSCNSNFAAEHVKGKRIGRCHAEAPARPGNQLGGIAQAEPCEDVLVDEWFRRWRMFVPSLSQEALLLSPACLGSPHAGGSGPNISFDGQDDCGTTGRTTKTGSTRMFGADTRLSDTKLSDSQTPKVCILQPKA